MSQITSSREVLVRLITIMAVEGTVCALNGNLFRRMAKELKGFTYTSKKFRIWLRGL